MPGDSAGAAEVSERSLKQFPRFVPNKKETFVCSQCPHAFDRHIMGGGLRGCMVLSCQCQANGTFSLPVPPVIQERVTDLYSGGNKAINQPAPPHNLGVI